MGDSDQRAGVPRFGEIHGHGDQGGLSHENRVDLRVGNVAHRDESRRSYGVGQGFRRGLGHQVHRQIAHQRAVAVNGGGGGEHLVHHAAHSSGLNEIRALGQKETGPHPPGVAMKLDRSHHPGGFRRQRCRRAHGLGAFRGGQAASPDGALTS